MRYFGLIVLVGEVLWIGLRENTCNMTVTSPDEGILDRRKYGEALGKGRGLHTGIPDYLPFLFSSNLL